MRMQPFSGQPRLRGTILGLTAMHTRRQPALRSRKKPLFSLFPPVLLNKYGLVLPPDGTLGRSRDGRWDGRKIKIARIYRPWDDGTAVHPQDTPLPSARSWPASVHLRSPKSTYVHIHVLPHPSTSFHLFLIACLAQVF